MIEATIRTARQLQVLRGRAASIRRGDQVAFLAPEGPEGKDVAGAVTAVRAASDTTVALVVVNRVHFVPADHQVVIIRDALQPGECNGGIHAGDQPRGAARARPKGGGGGGGGGAGHGDAGHARSPAGAATPTTGLCEKTMT